MSRAKGVSNIVKRLYFNKIIYWILQGKKEQANPLDHIQAGRSCKTDKWVSWRGLFVPRNTKIYMCDPVEL